MTLLIEYLPYLLIGFGVGYFLTLKKGRSTDLDNRKHDLEVQKGRLIVLANKRK